MSEVFSVKGFEIGEPYEVCTKNAIVTSDPHLAIIATLLNTDGACFVSSKGTRHPFKSVVFSESTMSVFFRILDGDELHTEPIITYQNHVVYSDVFQYQRDDASLRVCAFDAFIPSGVTIDTFMFTTTPVSDGTIVHVTETPLDFNKDVSVSEAIMYRDCLVLKQAIATLKYILPKPENNTKIKWVGSKRDHRSAKNSTIVFKTLTTGSFMDNASIDSLIHSIIHMPDALGYILNCVQNPITPPETSLTYNQVLAIIYAVIAGAENSDLLDLLHELQGQFAISSFNMYLMRLNHF